MREKSPQIILLSSSFILLTFFVAAQLTRPFDLWFTRLVQHEGNLFLDYAMCVFTIPGHVEVSTCILVAVTWYLYRKYEWPGAFLYLFFFAVLNLVILVLKTTLIAPGPGLEFDRNPFLWKTVQVSLPYAFPSGHTFRSVFLFGMWYQRLAQKGPGIAGNIKFQKGLVAAIIIATVISRVYLGDHWFSDVIGGMILAVLGVLLASQPPDVELRPA